jgi:epoxyqueuosine reductase
MVLSRKEAICRAALDAGFVRVRILAPYEPDVAEESAKLPAEHPAKLPAGTGASVPANYRQGSPSLLMTALPYGNQPLPGEDLRPPPPGAGVIAPFARRNYYREAVKRLQTLAALFRSRYGGTRADYRILCNSPVPEKPLARACGLGISGLNSLIITPEAGSLVIIAALTLPLVLEGDGPMRAAGEAFPLCRDCGENAERRLASSRRLAPPCMAACPTNAVRGDGTINRERCIQWYASGHGREVPAEVARFWGQRLYGCTLCQDACVWNQGLISGTQTEEGPLPAWLDCRELLTMPDAEISARFRGTAMGLSWLGQGGIKRNAAMVLGIYRT